MKNFLHTVRSMFLILSLLPLLLHAQPAGLTQLRKPSNMGKEFYFSFPPCYEVSGVNYLKLYITSTVRTKVRVEVEGKGFIQEKFTLPNDVVDFTLAPGVGQVFSKPSSDGVPAEQVYPQAAVHVTADAPIVVYAVTRFDFTSDSFLVLPIEALGKEYIISSMADMSWMYPGLSLPSESVIVAAYDNTQVTLTIGGNALTKTSGGLKSGQSKVFSLNRGDVFAVGNHADAKEGDLSGSRVVATKPVAVVSGNQCANVPTTLRWCDYIADMEMPTHAWGTTYFVPRHPIRKNSAMMKIFAKEPNTQIFRDGNYLTMLRTAGGVEGTGFYYGRINPDSNAVAVITADKPISVTIYPTGQEDDGVSTDPDQLVLYPVDNFSKEFLFCTPGIRGAKGFPRNEVELIYPLTQDGKIPDDLEFGTAQGGKFTWKKLSAVFGTSPGDKYAVVNGKNYAMKYIVMPGDGSYALRCASPIGIYCNGGSDYDSYLMSGGAIVRDLGSYMDKQAPLATVLNPNRRVMDGELTDLPNDAAIRSNLSKILLLPDSSENIQLKVNDASVLNQVTARWKLEVSNIYQKAKATLYFSDRAGNDSSIIALYTPAITAPPHILTPQGTSLCPGDSISLQGPDGFVLYRWSTGDTTPNIVLHSNKAPVNVYLELLHSSGQSFFSDTARITLARTPPPLVVRLKADSLLVENMAEYEEVELYKENTFLEKNTKGYFILKSEGNYSIYGKNKEGCLSLLSQTIHYVPVDVRMDGDIPLRLYPVPASDYLMLSMQGSAPSLVEIHSLQGNCLISLHIAETGTIQRQIDISALPAGVYFLQVRMGTQNIRQKLLKQ